MPIVKKRTYFYLFIFLSVVILLQQLGMAQDNSEQARPVLVVESIRISGNNKTRQGVILSLLDFNTGSRISQPQLDRNYRRLEETNFFKEVKVYTQPGSARGTIVVYIEVKERQWPFFQFKSGYSQLDGWYVSPLGLRFDNFFGRGNYAGIELLIGDRVSGLDISFLKPRVMNSHLNLRFLLFTRNRQFVHYPENRKHLQEVRNAGIGIRINGNKGLMKYLWFEFVRESFDADSTMWKAGDKDHRIDLPAGLRPFSGRKNVGRLIASLYADTRNQKSYPTSGWWGSVSFDQVSTEFGGFMDYKSVILDVRRYQEIGNGWVLAGRIKSAWIDDEAPFYEKFYLGGPNSLRGYSDRSLNPLGYASRLVQGSAELRIPITRTNFPRHFLTGVLFYDFGQAWSEPHRFDRQAFHTSLGYGFRFLLPIIGLVRVDFAYPIPSYDFKLHISLGHTF